MSCALCSHCQARTEEWQAWQAVLDKHGFSDAERAVLVDAYNRKRSDVAKLADRTGILPARLSRARDELTERGLIERAPDGRFRLVRNVLRREALRSAWLTWLASTDALDDVERLLMLDADDRRGVVYFDSLARRIKVNPADVRAALDRLTRDRLARVRTDGSIFCDYHQRPSRDERTNRDQDADSDVA